MTHDQAYFYGRKRGKIAALTITGIQSVRVFTNEAYLTEYKDRDSCEEFITFQNNLCESNQSCLLWIAYESGVLDEIDVQARFMVVQ